MKIKFNGVYLDSEGGLCRAGGSLNIPQDESDREYEIITSAPEPCPKCDTLMLGMSEIKEKEKQRIISIIEKMIDEFSSDNASIFKRCFICVNRED